jgi:hypothetical protein
MKTPKKTPQQLSLLSAKFHRHLSVSSESVGSTPKEKYSDEVKRLGKEAYDNMIVWELGRDCYVLILSRSSPRTTPYLPTVLTSPPCSPT